VKLCKLAMGTRSKGGRKELGHVLFWGGGIRGPRDLKKGGICPYCGIQMNQGKSLAYSSFISSSGRDSDLVATPSDVMKSL